MASSMVLEQGDPRSHYLSGFLWHGSCGRCHHFHIAQSIELPLLDEHVRFFCQRCQHPLFGIGRNSTQISLASVLTSSMSDAHREPPDEQSGCNLACTNTQADLNIGGINVGVMNEPGTQPHEGRISSGGRSRTTSPMVRPNRNSATGVSAGSAEPLHQLTTRIPFQAVKKVPGGGDNGSRVDSKRLFKRLRDRFKNGLIRSGGLLTPGPSDPSTSKRRRLSKQDAATMTEPCAPSKITSALDAQTIHTPLSRQAQDILTVPNRQVLPEPSGVDHGITEPPDELTSDTEGPGEPKRQSLLAHRAEKTLHKRALQRRKCHCSNNCHCMRGVTASARQSQTSELDSNQQILASIIDSIQPQLPVLHQPDHQTESRSTSRSHLGHLDDHRRRTLFRFASTHLDPTYQPSSTGTSPIRLGEPRGSDPSTSTGMSQATTLTGSRGSGRRRGRLPTQRTHSLPSIVLHDTVRFAEQARPEIVDAIRRHDAAFLQPSHGGRNTSHVETTDFASVSRQSTERSSSNVGENVYASATSLSRLVTVGNERQRSTHEVAADDSSLASLTLDESGLGTPQADTSAIDDMRASTPLRQEQPDEILGPFQRFEGEGRQDEA